MQFISYFDHKFNSINNELDNKYDCLLSANNLQENVFYKGIPVNFKPAPWPRSQDLEGCCTLPFVINILKRQNMINWGSCVGKSPYFYFLDKLFLIHHELIFFLYYQNN